MARSCALQMKLLCFLASISICHFSNRFNSLFSSPANEAPALQHLLSSTPTFQRFGFSTSASPETNEKKEQGTNVENKEDNADTKNEGAAAEDVADKKQESGSDYEGDLDDLSKDDLVKLANETKTVFKKFGVEKDDPTNEQFDPNRHNVVFQVLDNSKPAGTIAVVLKAGYTLHDRIIRPAEVGVTQAVGDGGAN